jgi:endoglucanase
MSRPGRVVSSRTAALPLVAAGSLVAALLAVATPAAQAQAAQAAQAAHASGPRPQVRVDQVGYLPSDAKHAYLMAGGAVRHATWKAVDAHGDVAASGSVGTANRGAWSAGYPDVYDITFSSLTTKGTYHLEISGDVTAHSPAFAVEDASAMYRRMLLDGVNFYQVQRDGPDVIAGALNRRPSHLNDAHAAVYATPNFVDPENDDTIADADLTKIAGPVDVSGGWFDAGDFLKFTHTAAYGDLLLYASARDLGDDAPSALTNEARFGEQWLEKMWDSKTRTLYLQVGIGTGNTAGTFYGDHDLWRLPQADDSDANPLDRYAAAHRPVFEAAPPGQPISPNLAGRVSAAFALAAQVDVRSDPSRAAREYADATQIYALADTSSPPNPLVTADPNEYYPESTWHDDMELGATEIGLAALALHHNAKPYLADAATWAKAYIASDTGDTFNLYDVSAMADADLVAALRITGVSGLAVGQSALLGELRRQIDAGQDHAAADPFRAAGNVNDFDVDAHTFGWIATEGWYQALTGDTRYAAFAVEERDWLFGANAWGMSFMVGEGDRFPECPQHQVANLSGSLDGTAPLAVGAVVNGPNDASNFEGGLGGLQDGMNKCPPNGGQALKKFDGQGARFVDDVRSWQTDEPALDMTGGAIIAAASQLALHDRR